MVESIIKFFIEGLMIASFVGVIAGILLLRDWYKNKNLVEAQKLEEAKNKVSYYDWDDECKTDSGVDYLAIFILMLAALWIFKYLM